VVRLAATAVGPSPPHSEGVVEDVAGPNDAGTGWAMIVRITSPDSHSPGEELVALSESELESTGVALDERGRRVPLSRRPAPCDLHDLIELRLFTEFADGVAAARGAEEIEQELKVALGGPTVALVAERHWRAPYNYEFLVTVEPLNDPLGALSWLALVGDGGWISCSDDGWRFDLWWSATADPDATFLLRQVHGAKVSFLPWHSPRRRLGSERPLLAVPIRSELAQPFEFDELLDAEPGDEEP
jgi:hypothetical protein